MADEIGLLIEAFIADITPIRSLIRVREQVISKITCTSKLLKKSCRDIKMLEWCSTYIQTSIPGSAFKSMAKHLSFFKHPSLGWVTDHRRGHL